MARSLTANMQTEVAASSLSPIILVKIELDSGDMNMWNGLGNLTFGGDTYTGAGEILKVSAISETAGLKAVGYEITLSNLNASVLSAAKDEDYQNRAAHIWFGAFDSSGNIIADPYEFRGKTDVLLIDEDSETSTATLKIENDLVDLESARKTLYTSENQKAEFAGDTGFDFIAGLQDKEIKWG